MKLTSSSIILALAALTQAAPPQTPAVMFTVAAESINDCNDSTFHDETSGASPKVSDCQTLASNIAGPGTWTIASFGSQRQLAQYGTCAFGVTADFVPPEVWVKVGNQDIIDTIHESVERYGSNGLVGAKGTMSCQAGPVEENIAVNWGLYHT